MQEADDNLDHLDNLDDFEYVPEDEDNSEDMITLD